jgi:5-formyltetrahydrofolate cyclo-ligase
MQFDEARRLEHMEMQTRVSKQNIRDTVRARRGVMLPAAKQTAKDQLTSRLITLVSQLGARSISCYLPVGNEPDTTGFLEWTLRHPTHTSQRQHEKYQATEHATSLLSGNTTQAEQSIDVLLPISRTDRLLDWARLQDSGVPAQPLKHTAAGRHGIPEPHGPRLPPETVSTVDALFIPACAIDRHGNRLGWGMGYFDRTLASLKQRPLVFTVVYDDEVLERLPAEPHDIPIDGAVTPSGVFNFHTRAR